MTSTTRLLWAGLITAVAFAGAAHGNHYKGYPWGYCTWYAATEFDKVAPHPKLNWGRYFGDASGHAMHWCDLAHRKGWVTTTNLYAPRVNAIIVWTGGGFGHVGIVDAVRSNGIRVREMNYGRIVDANRGITVNFGKVTYADLSWSQVSTRGSLRFVGYVYPQRR